MSEDPVLYLIKEIRSDIKDLNKKVDDLLELRWKITGAALVISFLVAFIFEIGKLTLKG